MAGDCSSLGKDSGAHRFPRPRMTVLRACVRCGSAGGGQLLRGAPAQALGDVTPKAAGHRLRSEEQRRAKRVLARYMYAYHWCGRANPPADHLDHIVPLAEGGADDETNLAPIHSTCHVEETAAEARRART